jgi:hypothetical protein
MFAKIKRPLSSKDVIYRQKCVFSKNVVLNIFCVFDSPDQSLPCGDYIEALGHEMDKTKVGLSKRKQRG